MGFPLKYLVGLSPVIAVLGEFVQATGPGPGNRIDSLESLLDPLDRGRPLQMSSRKLKI